VEATIVLASVIVLFAGFAVTQVVALVGGGRHVVETAGLTYADYARSGFFQLVAVAAIALAVLLTVDAFTGSPTGRARRRLVLLSEVVIGLTLVVVVSALRRLDLYESAYGLTMLRLYARRLRRVDRCFPGSARRLDSRGQPDRAGPGRRGDGRPPP